MIRSTRATQKIQADGHDEQHTWFRELQKANRLTRSSIVKALTEVALVLVEALSKVTLLAAGVVHVAGLATAAHGTTSVLLDLQERQREPSMPKIRFESGSSADVHAAASYLVHHTLPLSLS